MDLIMGNTAIRFALVCRYRIVVYRLFLARGVIYTSRAYATMSICDGSALAHYS